MAITVSDIMKLATFKEFRLVAGQGGIGKPVERSGILDYEYEEHFGRGQFVKESFVISSLLFAKDHPEVILEAVKGLWEDQVSGLAIKTIYFSELPQPVIDFANEKNFPIFLFDKSSAYFEDVITDITDKIRSADKFEIIESKLDTILNKNISKGLIRELALEINRDFQEAFFAVYCKEKKYKDDSRIISTIESIKRGAILTSESAIVKYRKGILIVKTDTLENRAKLNAAMKNILAEVEIDSRDYWVGFGLSDVKLENLDKSINEAMYAATACEAEQADVMDFAEIGTYGILLPNQDSFWMKNFHERITEPIKDYDEKYGTKMFETITAFVECRADIHKSAERLFIHNNTVRYRIGKVKEILGMENREGIFQEEIFLALKLEKIYKLK